MPDLTPLELRIALLWENGHDTWDIAKVIQMPESFVYRILPGIRARRRRR